jgi:hypothetical protein
MTTDEYVEDLNALAATGRSDFEAAAATYDQAADTTLADEPQTGLRDPSKQFRITQRAWFTAALHV